MLPAVNRDLFTLLARERQEQRREDAAAERAVRAHRSTRFGTTADSAGDSSAGPVGIRGLPVLHALHTWALSLPWTVERPSPAWPRGVRLFGVDCTPLARRRMWLTTHASEERGGRGRVSVSVVLPEGLSDFAVRDGWAVTDELPADHVLVTTDRNRDSPAPANLGAVLLTAYVYALF